MRQVITWFLAIFPLTISSLECGINPGAYGPHDQFNQIANSCISTIKKSSIIYGGYPSLPTDREEDEGPNSETGPRRGYPLYRTRRADNITTTNVTTTNITRNEENTNTTDSSAESSETDATTIIPENCIIQCIFQRLGMTEDNGYPEHRKILEGLLKTAGNRELRDFLQESTDECFQFMEQHAVADPCTYSTLLVTCLADKGRINCADWPVGNLPFH